MASADVRMRWWHSSSAVGMHACFMLGQEGLQQPIDVPVTLYQWSKFLLSPKFFLVTCWEWPGLASLFARIGHCSLSVLSSNACPEQPTLTRLTCCAALQASSRHLQRGLVVHCLILLLNQCTSIGASLRLGVWNVEEQFEVEVVVNRNTAVDHARTLQLLMTSCA